MSDGRVRRRLALGALQLFLLTTASLSPAAVARAQDDTEPPALTLETGAPGVTTFSAVGEEIEYTYLLTNTGGVALDAVSVTDTMVEDVLCQSGPLEPGGSLACTGAYAITQDDLDVGEVSNIALGEGTYGDEVVASEEAGLTITALAPAPPALTLQMEADPTTFSAVGEEIEYTYLLTNTGGVALDAVSVTDTVVEDALCGSGPLEPGGSLACTGAYAITQDDLDAGEVSNIALGEGTYGDGEEVASEEAGLTIAALAPEPPGLTLQMEADPTTFSAVGEEIEYTYLLTNTGGVALDAVSVTDTVVEDALCGSGPLEPDGSLACTGAYAITQDDLDAGEVSNIALGEGTYGDGEEVASDEASLTITALAPE